MTRGAYAVVYELWPQFEEGLVDYERVKQERYTTLRDAVRGAFTTRRELQSEQEGDYGVAVTVVNQQTDEVELVLAPSGDGERIDESTADVEEILKELGEDV